MLLYNKYLRGKTLSQVRVKPIDSPFWKGLMQVKDDFFQRDSIFVWDGMPTRLWEDTCLGDTSLATQCPTLYNNSQN
jgi:hypothetical protein